MFTWKKDKNSSNILKNKNKKGELNYQIKIYDETILRTMWDMNRKETKW